MPCRHTHHFAYSYFATTDAVKASELLLRCRSAGEMAPHVRVLHAVMLGADAPAKVDKLHFCSCFREQGTGSLHGHALLFSVKRDQ